MEKLADIKAVTTNNRKIIEESIIECTEKYFGKGKGKSRIQTNDLTKAARKI